MYSIVVVVGVKYITGCCCCKICKISPIVVVVTSNSIHTACGTLKISQLCSQNVVTLRSLISILF